MNKRKINEWIPEAYTVLTEVKTYDKKKNEDIYIVKECVIDKTWRAQISTFGAAIATGSLIAAIAYFSDQGSSSVHRELLMQAIERLVLPEKSKTTLFKYVVQEVKNGNEAKVKEDVLNAAIALKLAMNLYTLRKDESNA